VRALRPRTDDTNEIKDINDIGDPAWIWPPGGVTISPAQL
jgi:hypothetical protein